MVYLTSVKWTYAQQRRLEATLNFVIRITNIASSLCDILLIKFSYNLLINGLTAFGQLRAFDSTAVHVCTTTDRSTSQYTTPISAKFSAYG